MCLLGKNTEVRKETHKGGRVGLPSNGWTSQVLLPCVLKAIRLALSFSTRCSSEGERAIQEQGQLRGGNENEGRRAEEGRGTPRQTPTRQHMEREESKQERTGLEGTKRKKRENKNRKKEKRENSLGKSWNQTRGFASLAVKYRKYLYMLAIIAPVLSDWIYRWFGPPTLGIFGGRWGCAGACALPSGAYLALWSEVRGQNGVSFK